MNRMTIDQARRFIRANMPVARILIACETQEYRKLLFPDAALWAVRHPTDPILFTHAFVSSPESDRTAYMGMGYVASPSFMVFMYYGNINRECLARATMSAHLTIEIVENTPLQVSIADTTRWRDYASKQNEAAPVIVQSPIDTSSHGAM